MKHFFWNVVIDNVDVGLRKRTSLFLTTYPNAMRLTEKPRGPTGLDCFRREQ